MEKERPKIGVNVFVIKDGKILLGKRKKVAGDGQWGLPGGHLEMMESAVEGARRELEEETGLKAKKLTFLHVVNDPRPEEGKHYMHVDFLAEGVTGEPKLMEPEKCYGWEWLDLNKLPDEIFVGHKKLIPAYLSKAVFVD